MGATDRLAILADAIAWLKLAHDQGGGGVAGWYDFRTRTWAAAYPETTGYIIPTMLAYARRYDDADAHRRALVMARWLARVQLPDGGFCAGLVDSGAPAAVFNTGMALLGLVSALQSGDDAVLRTAAHAAGRWLTERQQPDGSWVETSIYTARRPLAYHVMVAWALFALAEAVGERAYRDSAARQLDWALERRQANGFFADNDLGRFGSGLTHTVGYVLLGLTKCARYGRRAACLAAVHKALDAIDRVTAADGFLAGELSPHWQPLQPWACLTGSAQIAAVSLGSVAREGRYRALGERLLGYLVGVYGACGDRRPAGLHGAHPVLPDSYMFARVPNWATKFLVDALLAWAEGEGV